MTRSILGLLVGKTGSGQRHVHRLVSLRFPLERLVLLEVLAGHGGAGNLNAKDL